MRVVKWVVIRAFRLVCGLLLRVQVIGMERLPRTGPVILAINHVNTIDGLLMRAILPRDIVGWAKAELWGNPLIRLAAQSLNTIPLRRGEMDLQSVRMALSVLANGGLLGIAPEGTRSWHGRLQRAHPGLIHLAQHAPQTWIQPLAIYGQESVKSHILRLRRTPVTVVFGQGFQIRVPAGAAARQSRQQAVDEVMAQIAALLPPQYRGVYSDLEASTEECLRFPTGASSNVKRGAASAAQAQART